METHGLLVKLKRQILHGEKKGEELINAEELFVIRKTLLKLHKKGLPNIDFITKSADLESINHYFSYGAMQYDQILNNVTNIIDPYLIELQNNNFEVILKRIEPTYNSQSFHENILDDYRRMEDAYNSRKFSEITTLSDKILTSIFKEICNINKIAFSTNDDFPCLYNKIKGIIKLDPSKYEDKTLKRFSGNISNILLKTNEIRNLYSDSHGVDEETFKKFQNLPQHHYKLILDSTKTISNFLINTYFYQNPIDPPLEF